MAVPMSPSSREIKRQSVNTATQQSRCSAQEELTRTVQGWELPAASTPSLTPLLTVDFSSISTLEQALNIKDRLSFQAILLRIDTENDHHEGCKSRVLYLRDLHNNDSARMMVYIKSGDEMETVPVFSVIRFNWAYRVISSTLNPYFRLYLDSGRSITVVDEHCEDCGKEDCPCKCLLSKPKIGALKVNVQGNAQDMYLPAIHIPQVETKHFKDISFSHLSKSYFSSDSLVIDLQFLTLEHSCSICNKRVNSPHCTTCLSCNGPVIFNVRAGVVLDDSSGVLAEAVVEQKEMWQNMLGLEDGLTQCLQELLEREEETVIYLTGSEIPDWLRKKVYENSGKVTRLILQCQSYIRQPDTLPDSFMRYLRACALPSEISLSRKLPSPLPSTRPALKVVAVSQLF